MTRLSITEQMNDRSSSWGAEVVECEECHALVLKTSLPDHERSHGKRPDGPLGHIYNRPPEPGDRALCGHEWSPDEAAAIWRGERMPPCDACVRSNR